MSIITQKGNLWQFFIQIRWKTGIESSKLLQNHSLMTPRKKSAQKPSIALHNSSIFSSQLSPPFPGISQTTNHPLIQKFKALIRRVMYTTRKLIQIQTNSYKATYKSTKPFITNSQNSNSFKSFASFTKRHSKYEKIRSMGLISRKLFVCAVFSAQPTFHSYRIYNAFECVRFSFS